MINTKVNATVIALKIPYVIKMLTAGATKSSTAISLLNLVKILPIGFESKNKIFALKMRSHIAKCKFEVVLIAILKIVDSLSKLEKIKKIRIPNRTNG